MYDDFQRAIHGLGYSKHQAELGAELICELESTFDILNELCSPVAEMILYGYCCQVLHPKEYKDSKSEMLAQAAFKNYADKMRALI